MSRHVHCTTHTGRPPSYEALTARQWATTSVQRCEATAIKLLLPRRCCCTVVVLHLEKQAANKKTTAANKKSCWTNGGQQPKTFWVFGFWGFRCFLGNRRKRRKPQNPKPKKFWVVGPRWSNRDFCWRLLFSRWQPVGTATFSAERTLI